MKRRFALSPEAPSDLVMIWRYIRKRTNLETADRIEAQIR
jgi:plasmid stabilization system protein ParE